MRYLLVDSYNDTVIHVNVECLGDLEFLNALIDNQLNNTFAMANDLLLVPLDRYACSDYNLSVHDFVEIVDEFNDIDT